MNKYAWLDGYLRAKPGATKDFKREWGWDRYMVGGRLFAATCQPGPQYKGYDCRELVTLKCEPLLAEALRATYPDIIPGFYSDKRCWNSIFLDGTVPDDVLQDLCDRSYRLVFGRLTKKLQKEIVSQAEGARVQTEQWDAYLEDGTHAGVDLVRGRPIPDGLYHLVAEVLVVHCDGDYLLMRRDLHKATYPGCWEPGAGGSVVKGEQAEDGARRELFEETGITAGALEPLGRSLDRERHSIYCCYLCRCDVDRDAIVLQPGETIDYRWVSEADFLYFMDNTPDMARLRARFAGYLQSRRSALGSSWPGKNVLSGPEGERE